MGAPLKKIDEHAATFVRLADQPSKAQLKLRQPPHAQAIPAASARSLLRFITCGSVDDGKSTLLGRILYETGAVFDDQLAALDRDSARFGTTGDDLDFALLVDGLAAEREQGITIDVAFRYFSTENRAFIAADTPGHEQYTRNMATGASTADVAIILIDARKGVLPQTRRHSYIVSMLGVRRVIVAVNKIDLVGYDESVFRAIETEYRALAAMLDFIEIHVIPVSARFGDNIVAPSARTPWRQGPALLELLETIDGAPHGAAQFRFPVQWVNRPNLDFRGFSGAIAGGSIAVGDRILALPRGRTSRIARIIGPDGDIGQAAAGQSVTLTLTDEIDISRGDVIVKADDSVAPARTATVRMLAMTETPVTPGRNYLVKIGSALTTARVTALHHQIDVHDYQPKPAQALAMNAIGLATLRFETDVVIEPYAQCQSLGGLLLIDPHDNSCAALAVVEADGQAQAAPSPARGHALLSWLGVSALQDDAAVARAAIAPWLAGAGLTGLIAFVASGRPLVATAAALVDAGVRPSLTRLVRSYRPRAVGASEDGLAGDGGGI
ncbi:MAG: sulfate adenylyltransferase subunit CysN [Hyphomicrobiales bacterium]|nr:sulfate adenylyltransferase subunit CysN [Hyphomicrobiales bacterium]